MRILLRFADSFKSEKQQLSRDFRLSTRETARENTSKNCFLALSLPTSKKCIPMRAARQARLLFFVQQVKNCFLVLSLPLKWPLA